MQNIKKIDIITVYLSSYFYMPAIRRRFHYGNVILNPQIVGKPTAAGRTVDVLLKDQIERIPLLGFLEQRQLPQSHRVKIKNITAYSAESDELGPWLDYGTRALMLGHYSPREGGVFLVLKGGLPIAWCPVSDEGFCN